MSVGGRVTGFRSRADAIAAWRANRQRQDPRIGLVGVEVQLEGKTVVFHPDDVTLIYDQPRGSASPLPRGSNTTPGR